MTQIHADHIENLTINNVAAAPPEEATPSGPPLRVPGRRRFIAGWVFAALGALVAKHPESTVQILTTVVDLIHSAA